MHFSSTIDRHCRSTNKMIHTQWGQSETRVPQDVMDANHHVQNHIAFLLIQCYPSSSDITTLFKQRHLCPPKNTCINMNNSPLFLDSDLNLLTFLGVAQNPSQLTVGSHPSSGSAWLPGRHQSNSPRWSLQTSSAVPGKGYPRVNQHRCGKPMGESPGK